MSHGKEESSYLPDNVPHEQLVRKNEKIIKKVRFHDDDPVTVLPADYPRVGSKRNPYRKASHSYTTFEDDEELPEESAIIDAEECDEQFAKL
jgi:hypothetical protein